MILEQKVGLHWLTLPRAWGFPVLKAGFKLRPEDFIVHEELGFEPDGKGEHLLLHVEKSGLSTFEAQTLLAQHFQSPLRDTAFSGMKDRQALTRQWFSVRPTGSVDEQTPLQHPQLRILAAQRNSRKLRRGSHRGNSFRILLREAQGDSGQLAERLQLLATEGVPNYFGQQRFGIGEQNIARAEAWFNGIGRPQRRERSLLLSSARSYLYNLCLAQRVAAASWNRAVEGDLMALAGTQSIFAANRASADELAQRLQAHDIHPTGPLWGKGSPATTGSALELELAVAMQCPVLAAGLEKENLEQERRPLRLQVQNLQVERSAEGLLLQFSLARGAYATAVLREVLGEK